MNILNINKNPNIASVNIGIKCRSVNICSIIAYITSPIIDITDRRINTILIIYNI